jgi:two-component system cell cycle sensor histidine kinase/response regulator CckA
LKKEAKTLARSTSALPQRAPQLAKVFRFFFSKKNDFLIDPYAALLDRQGQVLTSGDAFRTLAGSTPCFAEPAQGDLAEALRNARPLSLETELLTRSGTHPVALTLTPTGLDHPAAVLRLACLHRQRDLENRLAQAQRLQSVGQLAAGIAHDFNNLLTAILGAAEALEARPLGPAREDVAHIREAAERGAGLVRQLLAFGRQQTLQPRVLALNSALRDAAGLLRCMLGSCVALTLELDEPGRLVRIDPFQLDQVLLNLAANAKAAMPDGGSLTIATGRYLLLATETHWPDTVPPGRYATIELRDTGAGIPPTVLPHIFDPFFTTRRDSGGTGLGLSTVHGIVRQSGGYMGVTSTPGEGTVFRIFLPRHEARPTAPPQPAPVAPAGARLLLVDDEAPVRRLAARALRRAGWEVAEAAGAEEALEANLSGVAQLVSDVIMPGMDGPALVQELRKRLPGLPALLMSGYADPAQREALQADDIAFLAKPFSMARLVELVGTPQQGRKSA